MTMTMHVLCMAPTMAGHHFFWGPRKFFGISNDGIDIVQKRIHRVERFLRSARCRDFGLVLDALVGFQVGGFAEEGEAFGLEEAFGGY